MVSGCGLSISLKFLHLNVHSQSESLTHSKLSAWVREVVTYESHHHLDKAVKK